MAKTISISHAKEDAPLAGAITTQIDNVFDNNLDVFVSSIPGIIEPGTDWFNKIVGNLTDNNAFIVLVTPYSEKRPFVWFEVGFSWLRRINKKCEIYAICAPPIPPGNLNEPLGRLQAISLDNKAQTTAFSTKLIEQFKLGNIDALKFDQIRRSLPTYEEMYLDKAPIIKVADSNFQFKKLLPQANKSIFFVGQSFHNFTNDANSEDYENLMFKTLREKHISIRIMLSNPDPDCKDAMNAWTRVTGTGYRIDVEKSNKVFKGWKQRYQSEKHVLNGKLLIRKTHLAPVTITFVDKELDSGRLCLTPIINQGLSDLRSSFVIFKNEHPESFRYYYTIYNTLFTDKTETKEI